MVIPGQRIYLTDFSIIFQNSLLCDIQDIGSMNFHAHEVKGFVNIWSKLKLRTYCLINKSYTVEPCVKYNLNTRQRSLSAQLRSDTHRGWQV